MLDDDADVAADDDDDDEIVDMDEDDFILRAFVPDVAFECLDEEDDETDDGELIMKLNAAADVVVVVDVVVA